MGLPRVCGLDLPSRKNWHLAECPGPRSGLSAFGWAKAVFPSGSPEPPASRNGLTPGHFGPT